MYGNITLGDLIDWLEKQNPNLVVKDGFGSPHSDRGSYEELAFDPVEETTFGAMLDHAQSAVGSTYTGWKGGDFVMDRSTPVLIGEYGNCGDEICEIHFKYWLLTAHEVNR